MDSPARPRFRAVLDDADRGYARVDFRSSAAPGTRIHPGADRDHPAAVAARGEPAADLHFSGPGRSPSAAHDFG